MRKIITGLLGCLSLLAVLIRSGLASPDKGLSGYGPILGFSLANQCEKDSSNSFKLGLALGGFVTYSVIFLARCDSYFLAG